MSRRKVYSLLILCISLVWVCFGLWIASVNITDIHAHWNQGQETKTDLPWRFNEVRLNNVLTVEFQDRLLSPKVFHIVPDDHVTGIYLNGQAIPLADIPPEKLRDFNHGFHLDLSAHLTSGHHRLDIHFNNTWGPGGMDVRPVWNFWRYACLYLGVVGFAVGLGLLFRLRPAQHVLLALCLIPLFVYWSATPWLVRAHDVSWGGGHYDYIEHIGKQNALPKPTEGWVYYHPPAYYLAGALVWKAAKLAGFQVHETLQLFAIFLWVVFLVASLATINQFLRRRSWANMVASLALVFWPAGLVHSPAIGNDAALYAVLALATWLCCRWWFTGRRRHLIALALLCGLSLLIKSNGIVLVAAVGLLLLLRFAIQRRRRGRAFMDGVYFGAITGLSLVASMAVRVYFYVKGETSSWLISNIGNLHGGLRVPADIKAFIPLDIPTFLTQPYINSFNSATGRENFWNFLLRSSITGEFTFYHPLLTQLAYVMGVVLLLLFFALIVGVPRIWQTSRPQCYRHLPLLLSALLWLISLVILRIKVPYACSNDFRYVLPMILPLIIFWSTQGRWPRRLLVIMSLASAAFYTTVGLV